MPKISLKRIKSELEKKATLDEKKNYLSEILKKIKGPKLRAKVEKLLEEAEKHIEYEEKFEKEKLEHKISKAPDIEISEERISEIKYVPRRKAEAESGLEREIKSTPAESKFASFAPPKYLALERGGYMSSREAAERARLLLEERGMLKSMTAEEFYRMGPTQKQTLMKTVSEAIGTPLADYENLYSITKSIAVKPEEQYHTKTKKW